MPAKCPVISVGNIAMGGRGKTPVAALIARALVEAGERPAILSRGYKRRKPEEGVVVVSDGERIRVDVDRSGDEPLMLARMVPRAAVLVCDVRAMAAALAERTLGTTVHVLDDGFQHASLERDVDLVIVTPEDLRDRRLPFGRLRSPVSSLAKADAVVVDDPSGRPVEDLVAGIVDPSKTRVFSLRRRMGLPVPIDSSAPLPPGRWPVVAMAGIARPERFTSMLRDAGWHVSETITFPDHHPYRRRDVERVVARARDAGAGAILTTSKDAVRLEPLAPFPLPVAAVPLEVSIEPAEEFRRWLAMRVREAQHA